MSNGYPNAVLLLSGKRKSGKDYVADKLLHKFGKNKTVIIRLSGPLKFEYAKIHQLNADNLMDDSNYKEIYRQDMIKWGEEKRLQNPCFFCEEAITQYNAYNYPIWIISDARRITDLQYFSNKFGGILRTVRIVAPDDVRVARGWKFTHGVDDAESECGLDQIENWDLTLVNDGIEEHLEDAWKKLEVILPYGL